MKSPFGQVVIPAHLGSRHKNPTRVLPIIHSNENGVTVLDAFTFGKPTWKTISRTELEEIAPEAYSAFHDIPYSNPTYRFTGHIPTFFGEAK